MGSHSNTFTKLSGLREFVRQDEQKRESDRFQRESDRFQEKRIKEIPLKTGQASNAGHAGHGRNGGQGNRGCGGC
jgi:hypothetical protein